MPIRIVLADDHAIVRHGISRAIQQHEDIEVVGQTSDGLSTIDMVRELQPDVVLMDIAMPDINGIEATRQIVRDHPDVKIIALSMHSAKKFITEMLKAGASGYLLKDCEFEELVNAVREVISGKTYISPAIADVVVENFIRSSEEQGSSAFSSLSNREREVLQLMAEGNTTKQIGLLLHISPKTVEAHRLRVMNKLDIDNVAQLTKYAIQEGLTSPEV